MKECEYEVKGAGSTEEMMELVDLHGREAHSIVKVSPETREDPPVTRMRSLFISDG